MKLNEAFDLERDVYVYFSIVVNPDSQPIIDSLRDYIRDYLEKHLATDFKGFTFSFEDTDLACEFYLSLEGSCVYYYSFGPLDDYDRPYPDEMEQSVYADDFVKYVENIVNSFKSKNPKLPDGGSYDIKVTLEEDDFASMETVAAELRSYYDPAYYNEAVDAILSGVPIREAIMNKKTK